MCYRPDRFDVQQETWIKDENNGKNADFQLRPFLFPPGQYSVGYLGCLLNFSYGSGLISGCQPALLF
jgi:hypothetical protein